MLRVFLAMIIAMEVNVSDMQRDVRVVLEQNHTSTPLTTLGDVDTLTLDELIVSKLVPAAELVGNAAPLYMLDCVKGVELEDDNEQAVRFPAKTYNQSTSSWVDTFATASDHTGEYELPSDFMRMVSFKMEEWDYPVTDFLTIDNPLYARLKSRYPGIRSNNQRPIVALLHRQRTVASVPDEDPMYSENPSDADITWTTDGVMVLEFDIPIGGCLHLEQLLYVAYPSISGTGSGAKLTNISSQLVKSIVYMCASLVAQSLGDDGVSAKLLETSKQLGQWQ